MVLFALAVLAVPSGVLCAYMEPPPWSIHRESDYQDTAKPTEELRLETFLKYDTSLLQERFNGKHEKAKKWISDVVGVATKILLKLDIPVKLTPVGNIEYIDDTLFPNPPTLKRLSGLRRKKLTSYFCGNEADGNSGFAYFHSACNNLGAAVNVNAFSDDVIQAGRTLAQQLGHNLGIGLDSDLPCEKPWGYMHPKINQDSDWKGFWTACSNENFNNYYTDGVGACLKENGNRVGTALYPTNNVPTTDVSLSPQSTTDDIDSDNDDNGGKDVDNTNGNDDEENDFKEGEDIGEDNDSGEGDNQYQTGSSEEEYYDDEDGNNIDNLSGETEEEYNYDNYGGINNGVDNGCGPGYPIWLPCIVFG